MPPDNVSDWPCLPAASRPSSAPWPWRRCISSRRHRISLVAPIVLWAGDRPCTTNEPLGIPLEFGNDSNGAAAANQTHLRLATATVEPGVVLHDLFRSRYAVLWFFRGIMPPRAWDVPRRRLISSSLRREPLSCAVSTLVLLIFSRAGGSALLWISVSSGLRYYGFITGTGWDHPAFMR